MMHDVPRDFLHQLLDHNLGEFWWKDILDQGRIALSDAFELRCGTVSGVLLLIVVVISEW